MAVSKSYHSFNNKDIYIHMTLRNIIKELIIESFQGLTKKELDDIVNIQSIYGVTEQEKEIHSKKIQKLIYSFVMRKCPWILTLQYPSEKSWGNVEWETPFSPFFVSDQEEPLKSNWLDAFYMTINDQLEFFRHWINLDPKELKGKAKRERHWITRFKLARDLQRKHPTFERDLQNLKSYSESLFNLSPTSSVNPLNYPLYVSLYVVSREFGGQEEGGWYYNYWHYNDSIKVNSFKQARVAVIHLLKNASRYDAESLTIILEKNPRSQETKERPHYA